MQKTVGKYYEETEGEEKTQDEDEGGEYPADIQPSVPYTVVDGTTYYSYPNSTQQGFVISTTNSQMFGQPISSNFQLPYQSPYYMSSNNMFMQQGNTLVPLNILQPMGNQSNQNILQPNYIPPQVFQHPFQGPQNVQAFPPPMQQGNTLVPQQNVPGYQPPTQGPQNVAGYQPPDSWTSECCRDTSLKLMDLTMLRDTNLTVSYLRMLRDTNLTVRYLRMLPGYQPPHSWTSRMLPGYQPPTHGPQNVAWIPASNSWTSECSRIPASRLKDLRMFPDTSLHTHGPQNVPGYQTSQSGTSECYKDIILKVRHLRMFPDTSLRLQAPQNVTRTFHPQSPGTSEYAADQIKLQIEATRILAEYSSRKSKSQTSI